MCWAQGLRLSLPALLLLLLLLIFSSVAENAEYKNTRRAQPNGPGRKVFVPGSDASDFFTRSARRSGRYYAELRAEQQVQTSAGRRWRERDEERGSAYETYAEERRDERKEQTRERSEQFREFRSDGLRARQYWFH